MLTRPPAPAIASQEAVSPPLSLTSRRESDLVAVRLSLDVGDDLAERLEHLARARGETPEGLAGDLLRRALEQEAHRRQAEAALAGLTPRQREVARLAASGRTNRQIARELWLSPETVKTHLRRALEHFDLHSKTELRLLLRDVDGDRDPLQGAPLGCADATKRDPLQGAPLGCADATKRDPLQGAKRDADATQREGRPKRG